MDNDKLLIVNGERTYDVFKKKQTENKIRNKIKHIVDLLMFDGLYFIFLAIMF